MNAYTVYEVTRRTESQSPTFAGYQIEDEEIIEQVEVDADHSDCEVFYCERHAATFAMSDDRLEIQKDAADDLYAYCPECEEEYEGTEFNPDKMYATEHFEAHATDSADVIRVKVPGCGAQFEQTLNAADEVVEFKEVERNWFKAYDYENLSETPIIKRDGRWLRLYCDYSAVPSQDDAFSLQSFEEIKKIQGELAETAKTGIGFIDQANETDFEATFWAMARISEEGGSIYMASDEDGLYFAVEVG